MKKFLKIATVALVFCLTVVSFVACGDGVAARSELPDNTNVAQTPTTDDTKTPGETTTEPVTCGPDCACQSPVLCEHKICEHEWEDWLEIAHEGQLIKIRRCTKDNDHISYEVTALPDDPDTFTFDDAFLSNTTWHSDRGIDVVFHEKTYEIIGMNMGGTWSIKDNTVFLTETKSPTNPHGDQYQLDFDIVEHTLSHKEFYAMDCTFILSEEAV